MTSVVRIGRPPYPAEILAKLRAIGECVHPDPESEGYRSLRNAGINVLPVGSEIGPRTTLLLPESTGPLERLVEIVDRLLAPGGCPWDQAQTHQSLQKYLVEEAYELIEAINVNDQAQMKEELGDVLLQPLMHAAMLTRDGKGTIDEVAQGISDKLLRRHPHVFGDLEANDADEVLKNWDAIKKLEKGGDRPASILAGVPKSMPALLLALEVSKRAARSGFEWESAEDVWVKWEEERAELEQAVSRGHKPHIQEEFGDMLFTLVNVARWMKIDPESALRDTVTKFMKRFSSMEALAANPLESLSFKEWDVLWEAAKNIERAPPDPLTFS